MRQGTVRWDRCGPHRRCALPQCAACCPRCRRTWQIPEAHRYPSQMQQQPWRPIPTQGSGGSSSQQPLGAPGGPAELSRMAAAASLYMPLVRAAPCTARLQARWQGRIAAGQQMAAARLWAGAGQRLTVAQPLTTLPTCAGAPPHCALRSSSLRQTACSARARSQLAARPWRFAPLGCLAAPALAQQRQNPLQAASTGEPLLPAMPRATPSAAGRCRRRCCSLP